MRRKQSASLGRSDKPANTEKEPKEHKMRENAPSHAKPDSARQFQHRVFLQARYALE
jgi:hypothetical protein